MIITSIENQKNNKKRYNVYVDHSYAFSADYEDIIELSIKVDNAYEQEGLSRLIQRCQYKKAFDKAVNLLSIRLRSEREIKEKLKRQEYDDIIIGDVLSKLKELKYIDDLEFSRMWIESRRNLKPIGKRRLIEELKNKGIDQRIICDLINESDYDDLETAITIIRKKMKSIKTGMDDNKVYQRIYRHLIYRGIGYDTAHKALNICLNKDCEEI